MVAIACGMVFGPDILLGMLLNDVACAAYSSAFNFDGMLYGRLHFAAFFLPLNSLSDVLNVLV